MRDVDPTLAGACGRRVPAVVGLLRPAPPGRQRIDLERAGVAAFSRRVGEHATQLVAIEHRAGQ